MRSDLKKQLQDAGFTIHDVRSHLVTSMMQKAGFNLALDFYTPDYLFTKNGKGFFVKAILYKSGKYYLGEKQAQRIYEINNSIKRCLILCDNIFINMNSTIVNKAFDVCSTDGMQNEMFFIGKIKDAIALKDLDLYL